MYYLTQATCPQCGAACDKAVVILYAKEDTNGIPDIGEATRLCTRCWLGLDLLMAKLTGFAQTKEHLEKSGLIMPV
uniref:Uncharacterized protein n=1 Tax=viral metagenome TaxID=1070528 RepID=A0A6H1ZRS9_9ZZZZ